MQYLHAALVLHSSGKEITEKGIESIIKAAGGTPDQGKVKALVATLESIDIEEAIKGASLMPAGVSGAAAGAAQSKTDAEAETGDESEESDEEDEGDDLGLSALFG
ncbi:MAG: 50S ribosomal protein P1 [Candidatus Thorarchaeota archaeon]